MILWQNLRKKPSRNIFEFREKIFKQKCGTAIETKFALPYTILFRAYFEEKMLESFEK